MAKGIKVPIDGDSKGLQRSILKANLALEGIKLGAKAVGRALKQLGKAVADTSQQFGIQEEAEVSLGAALRRAGVQDVKAATEEFKQFAAELQRTTKFSDEVSIKAASIGASFGIIGDDLKKATALAQDMSAVLKTDLERNLILLGKAFKGETGTLSRYGIIIDQNLPKAQRFAAAMEAIQKQFGGAAAAMADTYLGRLKQLENSFGDLKEQIGSGFAPVLKEVFRVTTEHIQKINGAEGAWEVYRETVIKVAQALVKVAAVFVSIAGAAKKVTDPIRRSARVVRLAWGVAASGLAAAILGAFKKVVDGAIDTVEAIRTQLNRLPMFDIPPPQGLEEFRAKIAKEYDAAVQDVDAKTKKLVAVASGYVDAWKKSGEITDEALAFLAALDFALAGLTGKLQNLKNVGEGTGEAIGGIKEKTEDALPTLLEGIGIGAKVGAELGSSFTNAWEKASEFQQQLGQAMGHAASAMLDTESTGREAMRETIRALAAVAGAAVARWILQLVPPPAGPVLAPVAGAAASAAVNQIGKFHEGGIIGLDSGPRLPGMSSDERLIMGRVGERVLTEEQQGGMTFQSWLPMTESEAQRVWERLSKKRRAEALTDGRL